MSNMICHYCGATNIRCSNQNRKECWYCGAEIPLKLRLITFRLSDYLLNQLDKLVIEGTYSTRAEAIRTGIQNLITVEQNEENLGSQDYVKSKTN